VRTLLAWVVFLAYLGARPAPPPPSADHGDLTVSMVAEDTDLDDDVVSGPCTCASHTPDDGFQNFDCAAGVKLPFRGETFGIISASPGDQGRLDDGGLFRPPRTSSV
jgi:hypothetical protein